MGTLSGESFEGNVYKQTIGSTLGDAGVNIATFQLGRAEVGGDAVALIEIDEPLDEAVLDAVRALPGVVQARTLKF